MPSSRSGRAPFVLRELRWEDFPSRFTGFLALFDEVKENPDLGLTLPHRPPSESEEVGWFSDLYRRVRRGPDLAIVAEVDGAPVGMVTVLTPRFGGAGSESSHVGVLGILVDRRFRGRGVGEAMMVRVLELARTRFEIVRLTVFSVNGRAKRLYERLGFRTTGRLEREVKRGSRYLDEEIMALDLSGWRPPTPRPEGS